MVNSRSRAGRPRKNPEETVAENDGNKAEYEESRAQRIKENAERMKSLGIFDLSKNLKHQPTKQPRKSKPASTSSNDTPRRSSRLKDLPTVSYSVKKIPNVRVVKKVEIHIEEGENKEIYTEEDEKLLGDSKAVWELYKDGYDEEGQRMYDPFAGKSCHQCRQKTLGSHTECYKCKVVTGQFCGDCLYIRYGENINEAKENPEWICPVCRGICNCSRCRRVKGWMPTGTIYNKVVKLGFKSVAHYLIHTFRGQVGPDGGSLLMDDGKEELSIGALSAPSLGVSDKNEGEKHGMKLDSDEEYKGDDDEEGDDEDDEEDHEEDDDDGGSSGENDSQ